MQELPKHCHCLVGFQSEANGHAVVRSGLDPPGLNSGVVSVLVQPERVQDVGSKSLSLAQPRIRSEVVAVSPHVPDLSADVEGLQHQLMAGITHSLNSGRAESVGNVPEIALESNCLVHAHIKAHSRTRRLTKETAQDQVC